MGKYLREGKGVEKLVVMEVAHALGVRTRAKTLALEQDRKLALARIASLKKQRQSSRLDSYYLELRSRKLAKFPRGLGRRVRSMARQASLRELDTNSSTMGDHIKRSDERTKNRDSECVKRSEVEFAMKSKGELYAMEIDSKLATGREEEQETRSKEVCTMTKSDITVRPDEESTLRSASLDVRIAMEDVRGQGVASRPTLELSPPTIDNLGASCKLPSESGLSVPRSLIGQLESQAPPEDGSRGLGPYEAWPQEVAEQSYVSHYNRYAEVEASNESGVGQGDSGLPSSKKRYFVGTPLRNFSKVRDTDEDPGSSNRLGLDQMDRRMANHRHVMNRPYMRTNLFVDTQAIEDLFAAPERIEKLEGRLFTEKYNYDVVNDMPLRGRFEWIAEEASGTVNSEAQ